MKLWQFDLQACEPFNYTDEKKAYILFKSMKAAKREGSTFDEFLVGCHKDLNPDESLRTHWERLK